MCSDKTRVWRRGMHVTYACNIFYDFIVVLPSLWEPFKTIRYY